MLEQDLSAYPELVRKHRPSPEAIREAKKRVLDSLGCFYSAFPNKAARLIRRTFAGQPMVAQKEGEAALWGTDLRAPAEIAAWANGTAVRTLDYNDTYLSLEPCHPSDLLASIWAACELSGSRRQGRLLLYFTFFIHH